MSDADWVYITVNSADTTALRQTQKVPFEPITVFNAGPSGFENILRQPLKFFNRRAQVALYSITYTLRRNVPTSTFYVNTDLVVANQQVGNQFTNALARVTLENPGYIRNGQTFDSASSFIQESTYQVNNLQWIDCTDGEISSIATTITDDASLTGDPSDKFQKGWVPTTATPSSETDPRTYPTKPADFTWQYRDYQGQLLLEGLEVDDGSFSGTIPAVTAATNTVVTYVFRFIK